MACTNDFAAEDTNWLRHFASVNATHLSESVFFCIKYEDMLDIYAKFERLLQKEDRKRRKDMAFIAQAKSSHSGSDDSHADFDPSSSAIDCVYVVIRENPLEALKVTHLIQKMCSASFSFPPEPTSSAGSAADNEKVDEKAALQHVGLAFLNASVYGSATTAVCQLRPRISLAWSGIVSPLLYLNKTELLRMQQEHGQAHFYLASSLEDAVRFATQEGESAP
ncbi:unnamed protein product [Phytomonas sp. EM1]|nr:unnamed protein product [Phytomonas sp. EM1]|eukprot:CCW62246.1 unnamed protein product [Phytomonas sp. isolate EM1]